MHHLAPGPKRTAVGLEYRFLIISIDFLPCLEKSKDLYKIIRLGDSKTPRLEDASNSSS